MTGSAASARRLIVAMSLGGSAYGLNATMAVPALPEMRSALDASATGVGWVLSSYLIAAAVATGIIGRLGDVFGARRALVWTLVVFGIASVVCALADSLWLLLVGRILQGVGGAVYPLAYAILRGALPPGRREAALGLMAATLGIGGGAGPLAGGLITDHVSYRWIFVVVAVMALCGVGASLHAVPRSSSLAGHTGSIDVPGAALLAATVFAPLLAVSQANQWGWAAPRTLALFAAGAAFLIAFVWVERKVATPLVNMQTMAHAVVMRTNVVAIVYSAAAFGTLIAITLLAQQRTGSGYGLAATAAGLILLPHGIAILLGGRLAPRFTGRAGFRRPLILGQVFIVAGLAVFVPTFGSLPLAYVVSVAVGLGVGLALAANTNLVVESVPVEETATATGISTIIRNIGGAFGVQVTIALFSTHLVPGTSDFADRGLLLGFVFLACVAALGLALSTFVPHAALDTERR